VRTLYLAVGLSYIVTGLFVALLFVFVFRRQFSGHFWGAAVVAVVGSFIGGLVDFFFDDLIRMLTAINGVFNIFPPLIAASLLLTVFSYLSERKDEYGD
jgi:membrane protein YqaA with SNARE-associated domain